LATRTVASDPPLNSGSAGTHVGDSGPVVATDRDDLGVTHRNAGDVVDGDRALVVSQPIRSGALPKDAHRPIHTPDQGGQGAVPGRDHYPERDQRQPRAEQIRGPAVDDRARTPVPLGPHPRFGDPWPMHPPPTRRHDLIPADITVHPLTPRRSAGGASRGIPSACSILCHGPVHGQRDNLRPARVPAILGRVGIRRERGDRLRTAPS
jgi:hypothetical protein